MLIGIDFGDNDFNMTVRAFLKLFIDSTIVECYPHNVTKANILKIWNECFYGIYLAAQNGFYEDSLNKLDKESEEHLKKYLSFRVKEKNIYLGQECLDHFTEDNNYEFNYIDTDTGEILSS